MANDPGGRVAGKMAIVTGGAIRTEANAHQLEPLEEAAKPYGPRAMTPLRRVGESIELANAALFLASDEASYITGTTLNVSGGR